MPRCASHSTAMEPPIRLHIAESNGVVTLKCEVVPRAACVMITSHSSARVMSTVQASALTSRARPRTKPSIHTSVTL
ncbi:hypothetical protein DAERI_010564 [Deinococcus aerius]|uniref:Uncharacterized protein n=1 Tax=Deinococcus aerius TaxID=200253 RepID=A0A2I9CS19_9DEIO|nr:hypothetical protein [Deinococcus aerius]GBF04392.1 hypothetical protein DAERI_010564 [Deinococcus aerius]